MTMDKTRVLIVDDHSILRMGLASLIGTHKDIEVAGDADGGPAALKKFMQLKPDVVIMDLVMPGMDGIETTLEIISREPDAKILILTTFGTSADVSRAVSNGASGAIMKDATNEELVNSTFASELGAEILDRLPIINEFYEKDFEGVKAVCGFDPKASEIVKAVRGMGLKTALATMPVFPRVATESRMRWAGLDAEDFELVTTLENSCFCKPNPNYYTDIAKRLGVLPEECLMVGNDTLDDMEAEEAGMNVFLLTDCLVNRENKDISRYKNGGFDELLTYINEKMTV